MTEWWVSQAKHWCKVCKVWTGGHKSQILKHEGGRMHAENQEKMLKDAREREKDRVSEEKDVLSQLAAIEAAAAAACPEGAMAQADAQAEAAAAAEAQKHRPQPQGAALALARPTSLLLGDVRAERSRAPVGSREDIEAEYAKQCSDIENTVAAYKRRKTEEAAAAAAAACHWTEHKDPGSGCPYWHNTATGESSWTRPAELEAAAAAASSAAVAVQGQAASSSAASSKAVAVHGQTASSSGWTEHRDPGSGQAYWYNPATKESRWTVPPELAVAAPAAPAAVPQLAAVAAGRPLRPPQLAAVDPTAPAGAPATSSAPRAKARAWVACTDPGSGQVYYFDTLSQESTWQKPADFGLDLSKPPPPPPKKKAAPLNAAVGQWEEVKPGESMWGRPADPAESSAPGEIVGDESEEETPVDQLTGAKAELMARRGVFAAEDLQTHTKEMRQIGTTSGGLAGGGFPLSRKRAAGIRKSGGTE